ncbi:hypothetical protein JKP88DRAFT_325393 [Tribonema minus]|uniref:Uncharacterized protein n=1 Tax=Tribonema minus TaxID=303371 RepID=A0A835YR93_9STRA|nr:hypothetical protein JKP88DRAFT_325393 [Tribonema minus]
MSSNKDPYKRSATGWSTVMYQQQQRNCCVEAATARRHHHPRAAGGQQHNCGAERDTTLVSTGLSLVPAPVTAAGTLVPFAQGTVATVARILVDADVFRAFSNGYPRLQQFVASQQQRLPKQWGGYIIQINYSPLLFQKRLPDNSLHDVAYVKTAQTSSSPNTAPLISATRKRRAGGFGLNSAMLSHIMEAAATHVAYATTHGGEQQVRRIVSTLASGAPQQALATMQLIYTQYGTDVLQKVLDRRAREAAAEDTERLRASIEAAEATAKELQAVQAYKTGGHESGASRGELGAKGG